MKSSTIQHLHLIKQDIKEGIYTMKGLALTKLLHNLIREYGTYEDSSYAVDPKVFSLPDMKLILSHILDSEDYAFACENRERLEAMFMEYIDIVQSLLDNECDAVYHDDMEEMGMKRYRHQDNGETYWANR
jgi:hypothetical protein